MPHVDPPSPADNFERHRRELAELSDDEFMVALTSMAPLPDVEDLDPAWDEETNFDRADRLLAFADGIGERRLVRAIAPLYERAALGDVFEMLRWLRHGPEQAVAPDWGVLTEIMRPLVRHARAGTRRWAVRELGVLRDPAGFPELALAIDDPEPTVRSEACTSLGMLAELLGEEGRAIARQLFMKARDRDPDVDVSASAADALRSIPSINGHKNDE